MPRKRFTAEQIISRLREAEVLFSQGRTAAEACRAAERLKPFSARMIP